MAGSRQLYVLFVHYVLKNKPEHAGGQWEIAQDSGRNKAKIKFHWPNLAADLRRDLGYLRDVLVSDQGWEGFAFVFVDPGWTALLKTELTADSIVESFDEFPNKLEEHQVLPSGMFGSGNIRIVTAKDLTALLETLKGNLDSSKQKELFTLLAGGADRLLYDGAKVIEAAIRIANIGRDVPILRFDHDVLFAGPRKKHVDSRLEIERARTNIRRLCDHYRALALNPRISYFIFSGRYMEQVQPGVGLANGYATRVAYLAAIPGPYANFGPNHEVDLTEGNCRKFLDNLWHVGANPYVQVVSGAGLCLSDSAVLDLPPCSNMRLNVMWIDDHLKYALHHELRHFGYKQNTGQVARVDAAVFEKPRHHDAILLGDVQWHFSNYLLGLVLGCIADRWLRMDERLKRKLSTPHLSEADFVAVINKVPGFYADALLKALRGQLQAAERETLRTDLWKTAKKRLNEIVEQWGKDEFAGSFLWFFVEAPKSVRGMGYDRFLPKNFKEGLRAAVDELNRHDEPLDTTLLKTAEQNDLSLPEAVSVLVDDFLTYIDLAVFWRHFVSAVRSLLAGKDQLEKAKWLYPAHLGEL